MSQAHLFVIGILLAWLAGIRVYLTVFGVGLAGLLGWIDLPPALHPAQSWWVLGTSGALAVAEFFADKIPGVDSGWDLLQTLARVPAGAFRSRPTATWAQARWPPVQAWRSPATRSRPAPAHCSTLRPNRPATGSPPWPKTPSPPRTWHWHWRTPGWHWVLRWAPACWRGWWCGGSGDCCGAACVGWLRRCAPPPRQLHAAPRYREVHRIIAATVGSIDGRPRSGFFHHA